MLKLERTMVYRGGIQSVKAQEQEGWRSCRRGSKTDLNFQFVNKPSQIVINSEYPLIVKNNNGEGMGG